MEEEEETILLHRRDGAAVRGVIKLRGNWNGTSITAGDHFPAIGPALSGQHRSGSFVGRPIGGSGPRVGGGEAKGEECKGGGRGVKDEETRQIHRHDSSVLMVNGDWYSCVASCVFSRSPFFSRT